MIETQVTKPLFLFSKCVGMIVAGALSAHGDILTDPGELSETNTILDFESLSSGAISNPLAIGDATFSSSTEMFINDVSGFGADGSFVSGNTLASDNFTESYVDIRMDFADDVGEIGLGWFDPNFFGNRLEVYSSSDSLLEFADVPTGPVGGSFAAFRGIRRRQNDISYAIARVSASNDVYSIDNVSFGTAIPEPSTLM